jgi:predicted amidohydrolase
LIGVEKADLLVLPELFATGYTFTSRDEALSVAEAPGEQTTDFLMEIAAAIDGTVVAGFAERDGQKVHNSAMMVSPEGIVHVYRKLHLYYKEKLWFTPSDRSLAVQDIGEARVGIMICFDWFFPEVARTLALLGADIIAHPANLVMPYCQKAMVTRCLENHVFAVTANRIGRETRGDDEFTFTGGSQITGPSGVIHASAPSDEEAITILSINPKIAKNKKINEYNDLFEDRRPKFYSS